MSGMSGRLGNFYEYLEKKIYRGLPNENLTPYQFLKPFFPTRYKKTKKSE